MGWGGVGWWGVLTFWRPRPWYYVDKTCRGNLEDVLDATLMTWGGVGWGGVLTSWRPRPWYYVDKTCRGNLEDVLDATLMTWGGVGWGGVVGCINVLTTTSLILRRQDMPKKKLMKDPHTKSLCPFFEHQVYAWAWRENLGQLSAKIFLRQLTKFWWTAQ